MHNIPLILRCVWILLPRLCITKRLFSGMTEQASTEQSQGLQTGSILHSRYQLERFWPAAVRPALLFGAASVATQYDPAHSSSGMSSMNVRMPAPPLRNVDLGAAGKDGARMFGNISMSLADTKNADAETNDSLPAEKPGVVYPRGTEFDSKQMKHLGKGKFGDVWEATDLETGERVVVKFFYDKNTNEYLTWNKASEVQKWTMIKNIEECKVNKELVSTGKRMYPSGARRICECKAEHISQGLTNPDSAMYTVWEMVGNDDLTTIQMPTNMKDRIQIARSITKQVAEVIALLSMFNPPIIHHDLKGENVVLSGSFDEGFDVNIIDFGCFIPAAEDMKNSQSIGDPAYMPPEHTVAHPFCAFADPPSSFDMYAVGLIHMELLCPELTREEWYPKDLEDGARPVLKVGNIIKAMRSKRKMLKEDLTFTAEDLKLFKEDLSLIENLLHGTPDLRPTPMEVVQQLSDGVKKKSLMHEKIDFKEGDAVEMLIDMKWVQCVVSKSAEDTYDIVWWDEKCNDEGDDCTVEETVFSGVDPARVKAVGETPSIDVPDVRPGSNLPGMERDPVERDPLDRY